MVRKQKSQMAVQGTEVLEAFEQEAESEVKKINDIRKKEFRSEMDSAFFFSVVFDTRAERDAWLKDHNIILEEDFFVKSKDFLV